MNEEEGFREWRLKVFHEFYELLIVIILFSYIKYCLEFVFTRAITIRSVSFTNRKIVPGIAIQLLKVIMLAGMPAFIALQAKDKARSFVQVRAILLWSCHPFKSQETVPVHTDNFKGLIYNVFDNSS